MVYLLTIYITFQFLSTSLSRGAYIQDNNVIIITLTNHLLRRISTIGIKNAKVFPDPVT